MAGPTLSTLIDQTRQFIQDWPDQDALTASVSSSGTTLTVADGTLYPKNFHIEIDQETLTVSAAGTGTSVTVRRGARGSTAVSHATSSTVLIRPNYSVVQIINALNMAKGETFPLIYKPVLDTSLSSTSGTYEYTVPNMPSTYSGVSVPIPYLSKIELKATGQTDYVTVRNWWIKRGTTPKIQFPVDVDPGTLRVHGFGPFPDLTAVTDTFDALWPQNANQVLVVGAAAWLMASGEAGRASVDTLATDSRESANRVGASLSISNTLYGRFRSMLLAAAMPRLPTHMKTTF